MSAKRENIELNCVRCLRCVQLAVSAARTMVRGSTHDLWMTNIAIPHCSVPGAIAHKDFCQSSRIQSQATFAPQQKKREGKSTFYVSREIITKEKEEEKQNNHSKYAWVKRLHNERNQKKTIEKTDTICRCDLCEWDRCLCGSRIGTYLRLMRASRFIRLSFLFFGSSSGCSSSIARCSHGSHTQTHTWRPIRKETDKIWLRANTNSVRQWGRHTNERVEWRKKRRRKYSSFFSFSIGGVLLWCCALSRIFYSFFSFTICQNRLANAFVEKEKKCTAFWHFRCEFCLLTRPVWMCSD